MKIKRFTPILPNIVIKYKTKVLRYQKNVEGELKENVSPVKFIKECFSVT